ncbi:MAG: formate/nitrite transporter family protein [Oscillospiraceae bacterium]|nr:formate/nitrite transporter family protein [Oscillospiraceae bacterium]
MLRIFLSALLAGAVIAIGGTVCLSLESAVAGALFFTVGLFAVCTRSLHLFTGKVCYVFENDRAYARTLPVIWLGNFAGTALVAAAEQLTRLSALGARAQALCAVKLSEPLFGAFLLAVLCNVMIYLAVDGYRANPHELGKYLSLFFGVCVFILCGFEHCVANMYYFTMGGAWSLRTFGYLLVMTLGNAVGGVIGPLCHKLLSPADGAAQ